ncbi:hypothetical protein [Microvirga lotononidis]|uniref:Uncharacterized protein n=1 Tax=Microvirga lotononidis TaxID=864069 RepID=I4YNI0_9HYPH|nr:hypothetical protein [Microvirga lotononidis]EIM25522.1 hypothetical protein MicloDRAFT_00062490 [Microvirga lotononidis]WQO26168.1 hypothetical protein U0023_15865 [Microvirga lotononidis]
MIIALLALAFAMIVGGLLTAFFGWDIVLVERGWTMVIAGSITAASGALLLGIAAAVSKLARIEARLSQLRGDLDEEPLLATPGSLKEPSLAALSGGAMAGTAAEALEEGERADERQAILPLFEGEGHREPVEEEVKAAEWPEEPRVSEPVMPFPPRPVPTPAPIRDEDEPDMKVPDFLLAERARDEDEEPRVLDGADLYHRDPAEREPETATRAFDERDESREPVAETASPVEPEPEREPETAPEEEGEAEEERETAPDGSHPAVVVGTYNSGDNKYVMFSDGSIEAQTPSGVFRFQSLDELKAFIAAGGEGGSSPST